MSDRSPDPYPPGGPPAPEQVTDPLEERVVESRLIHRGRYLEFRVDTIERADGSRGSRDVVRHPGAIAVLAVDTDDRILLVRQWRSPAGRALLEVPAGTLDVHDGVTEDPDLAARRELEEETGHRATTWRKLAAFWTAPGFASEYMHLYLATGIAGAEGDDRLQPDEDERLELRHVTLAEALSLVETGEIADAKSILAILWLDRIRRTEPLAGDASSERVVVPFKFGPWAWAAANARLMWHQRALTVFGGVLLLSGILTLLLGAGPDVYGPGLGMGLLVLSGLLVVPFALWSYRGKGDIFEHMEIAFDDRQVRYRSVAGESEIPWHAITKVLRSGPVLFLYLRAGGPGIVSATAFEPQQLEAFHRLAMRHGLTLDGHRVDPAP